MSEAPRALTERDRPDARRWLNDWSKAGPVMEAERWERVAALSEDQAWEETLGLFAMWEPQWTGDAGEELVLHQDLFARVSRDRTQ